MPHPDRTYAQIQLPDLSSATREARMDALAQALWETFSDQAVSWIGFYLGPGQRLADGRIVSPDEMLLGPCRNAPACSPIALHGACGQCWTSGKPVVVRDVAELGENYVACDPRDRSEVVVPLFDEEGRCYAVLDADSFDVGAFEDRDARELIEVCTRAGLTVGVCSR